MEIPDAKERPGIEGGSSQKYDHGMEDVPQLAASDSPSYGTPGMGPEETLYQRFTTGSWKRMAEANQDSNTIHLKPFPFLKLPFDIRRLVYEELYLRRQIINLSYFDKKPWYVCPARKYSLPRASTAFLRTCSTVNSEAYKVLYGTNIFVFYSHTRSDYSNLIFDPTSKIRVLPSICRRISRLHIIVEDTLKYDERMWLFKALPDFPNVTITIAPLDTPSSRRVFYFNGATARERLLAHKGNYFKEIASFRKNCGLTWWDDLEDKEIGMMLRNVMPEGFHKASRSTIRRWWRQWGSCSVEFEGQSVPIGLSEFLEVIIQDSYGGRPI